MTKTEQPVLRLKLQGPRVKRGRIAVPDLIKICQEAQAAVKRQAEALEGRKTLHPGPVSSLIRGECTLELIGIKKGGTTLEFAFTQPRMRVVDGGAIGTEALAELALSIKSLGNGNKRMIDPGVLQSIYNLGELVEGTSITSIQWIVPGHGKQRRLEAPLNPTVRDRAAQRLSALIPIPSIVLGEGSFSNGISLVELAGTQNVKPLRNLSALAGAIPADQDVDDFLDVIYSARR